MLGLVLALKLGLRLGMG